MARVQSSTPGGGFDWQFRCGDGGCRRTYQRPAPLCTHVTHGMESDDPAVVAAMHLAYAATFDPSVYVRCAPRAGCSRSGHNVFHGARAAARAATCEFCSPAPPPPSAPPPGLALLASATGVRALQRQHALATASAAHDAALVATPRWWATLDFYRMMPRTPLREAAEAGADPAADGVLPAVVDSLRRVAKLAVVQELRRARQA
eukprot:jgi/Tetstr1/463399/TSEL_008321.t1